jgi:hypothetical protein
MTKFTRTLSAITAFVFTLPLLATSAELNMNEKDSIFIGDLKVQPSVVELAGKKRRQIELKRVVDSLETQFITALNATRVFQLVERNRKTEIEQEQAFAGASADPDDKSAAQEGRMAGAKYAFLPQIDGFEDAVETVEYQAIDRVSISRKLFLSAVVQIVDTTTGKLLPESPSIQLTKTEEIENSRMGQPAGSDEAIVALAKEMAGKLSQDIAAFLRPAKVLSITDRQIMFNRGIEAGFKKGDLVEIYSIQNVKDEDTGEVFRNEMPVGQGIINRIDKYQSYATISGEDLGIIKGCVVRFLKTAAGRAAEAETPPDATQPGFAVKGNAAGESPGSSEKPLKWK